MNRQEYDGANAQTVKVCKTCLKKKPLEDFTPHKTCRLGRQPHCRVCINRQQREARADAVAPNQADLHRLFRYDGLHLWWRERPSSIVDISKPAGTIDSSRGYRRIKVNGKIYSAHRLIWLFVHGTWPRHQIDHIDHDRLNNRIENLRDTKENALNQSTPKNNSSGVVGISWHKRCKKWQASITVSGKLVHLGVFTRKDDAIQARKEAERKYGYHKNHGS
jgi:hypothetical protein